MLYVRDECLLLTRHGLEGSGPAVATLSQNDVSTTELRASPGRAELGLRLRLIRAVWGSENNGGCDRSNNVDVKLANHLLNKGLQKMRNRVKIYIILYAI